MNEKDEVIPVVDYEIVDSIPEHDPALPVVDKADVPASAIPAPDPKWLYKGYFQKGGRPGPGRKRLYQTADEVYKACSDYFASLQFQAFNEKTHEMETYWRVGPTMAGLARSLGMTRQALHQYGRTEEFGDVVDWARDCIYEFYETAVQRPGNQSGIIFTMKNYGYSDTKTVTYEPPSRLQAAQSPDEIAKLVDEDIV